MIFLFLSKLSIHLMVSGSLERSVLTLHSTKLFGVKKISELNLKENKKIHLGFVSGDFTDQHSIFYFLKDTLKFLDRNIFKIYLFSFNRTQNDYILGQKEIKSVADEFIDLENYNNQ